MNSCKCFTSILFCSSLFGDIIILPNLSHLSYDSSCVGPMKHMKPHPKNLHLNYFMPLQSRRCGQYGVLVLFLGKPIPLGDSSQQNVNPQGKKVKQKTTELGEGNEPTKNSGIGNCSTSYRTSTRLFMLTGGGDNNKKSFTDSSSALLLPKESDSIPFL